MGKSETPVISKLSDKQTESFLPCGIPELDAILGGGFPVGRITEISGREGTGKTYLVTKLIASLSKEHKVLFIDAEFSANQERMATLGVTTQNVDYLADSRLEEVCETIISNIGKYDLVILDSLASLIPLTIESQNVGDSSNIGVFARLIKQFALKMRPVLGRSNTALVVINQMRAAIGMYATVELPGGRAWAHVCDIRLRLSTSSNDKIVKDKIRIGHVVHAVCNKNKCAQPFVETSFKLLY